MRIALLTDGIYPYVVGGMQRHSFYLAKYFAAHGHKVDLYHTNQSEYDINRLEFFTEEEKANIRSFVLKFPSLSKSFGHYIRESYEYSRNIYTIFQEQAPPDFVYCKGFAGWELINQKQKGVALPPVGVNFHGYEMFQKMPSFVEWLKFALLFRGPVRFCTTNADYVFSYGGKISGIIQSLGVPAAQIVEIPAGITEDWLVKEAPVKQQRTKFVFMGRFERRKGLPELYEALRAMPKSLPFGFTFVGDIPSTKRIAGERYDYTGKLTDAAKLKEVLRSAHVLVCPSISEGMPNVILEGMASGLAVIATDTGATSIAVNSSNGWLLEPGNVSQLKKAIQEATELSPELLKAKGQQSLNDIRTKFSWEKIGSDTVNKIQQLIA